MCYYSEGAQQVINRETQKWSEHLLSFEEPYKEMTKILGMKIFVLEQEIEKLRDLKNVSQIKR